MATRRENQPAGDPAPPVQSAATPADWAPRAVEAALDAVITIDSLGRVLQFNRAAERMFGYRREHVVGRELADMIIPRDLRAEHWAGLLRLTAGESPRILDRRVELRAMRRGGEEFPVELTVTQTSDSPPAWTGYVRDLTNLRAAEHRGSRAAHRFAAAEDLTQMGSWELELGTNRVAWSDGMYRIHGFDPHVFEPGIESYLEHVHIDDRERTAEVVSSVVEDPDGVPEQGVTLEYRVLRPDGAVREIRARGRIEADERGRPARCVGVAQDITEQRLTERELHAHYAVEQAFREWESFDEGVSALLRRLGTALEFELGSLWTWNAEAGTLSCRSFWSAPGIDADDFERVTRSVTFRPGHGVHGRAFETGEPVLTENLSTDPRLPRRAAAARLGLRAGLAFPAVGDDGPLAVLSYYSFHKHEPSQRLLRTLTGIGRELGRFLERRRADLAPRRISKRELDVLRLASEGNTGPQIAEQLVLSPATVKTHFEHIYGKLGVSDRAGAVAHAMRIGLIR